MKKRKVSNSTPFALGIVTRKGGDLRKQGSVSEASIARPVGERPIPHLPQNLPVLIHIRRRGFRRGIRWGCIGANVACP